MTEARNAIEADSTVAMRWTAQEQPTITVLVSEPGARLSAEVFGGHTLIATDASGTAYATDFYVTAQLPLYYPETGRYGQEGEKAKAWSAERTPAVGKDIVIGQSFGDIPGSPAIVQVSIDGDALSFVHGLDEASVSKLETPAVEYPAPNPTTSADEYLQRAHTALDNRH